MSDQKYQISIELKNGLKNLRKFQSAAQKFDKGRTTAIKAQRTLLADNLKKEETAYNKTQAALTKRLEREEKERTRVAISEAKKRLHQEKSLRSTGSARVRQAVGNITATSGAESMRDHYRKLEKDSLAVARAKTKETNKQSRADAARVSSLEKAKENVRNSALMTEKEASAAQRAAQSRIKSKIALAKSAAEVRGIVAQERASLRLAKKKSFLVNRMNASSKEFAGNMVSAFAVASAGVFITQTGQQFQSASNTMLSVSENAQEAQDNLAFVKEEAFRLGLGLTEATKGFAKLAAAKGEMGLEDTKELFLGVSEASTLLGLSAEESNRALLAVQQINGLAA